MVLWLRSQDDILYIVVFPENISLEPVGGFSTEFHKYIHVYHWNLPKRLLGPDDTNTIFKAKEGL